MYIKTKCLLTRSHKIRTSWLTTLNTHILFRITGCKNDLHSRYQFFYSVSSKSYLGICLEILLDRKSLWEQLSQISTLPFTWQDPPGLEKISSPTQLLSERSFCFFQEILFRTTLQISELCVKWKLSGHLPLPFWLYLEISYGFSPFLGSLESHVARGNIHIAGLLLFQTYLGMTKWWVCILVQVQNSGGVTTLIV